MWIWAPGCKFTLFCREATFVVHLRTFKCKFSGLKLWLCKTVTNMKYVINLFQWNWLIRHEWDLILILVWETYCWNPILDALQDSAVCANQRKKTAFEISDFLAVKTNSIQEPTSHQRAAKKLNLSSWFPMCVSSSQEMIKW